MACSTNPAWLYVIISAVTAITPGCSPPPDTRFEGATLELCTLNLPLVVWDEELLVEVGVAIGHCLDREFLDATLSVCSTERKAAVPVIEQAANDLSESFGVARRRQDARVVEDFGKGTHAVGGDRDAHTHR
jgi:hypothetical protein